MVLPTANETRGWKGWGAAMQLLIAAAIVLIMGFQMPRWSARPSNVLLGLAVAVVLAALVSGRRGAWLAITLAAVMGALQLPPGDSMYIDPSYRLGYGLFLALCLLITLYHPPRASVPVERRNRTRSNRKASYTEADLPTLAPPTRGAVEALTCEVAGLDIYKWERACAHLSDVIADAQIKLQENDRDQAYHLLQHAYELAADTRRHIQQTDIFVKSHLEDKT